MLLRLALRNLTRNIRRTLLSLISIVAGVCVLIVGQGFIGGLDENIIRTQIDNLSGHVLLRPSAYPTEGLQHPVDVLISPDEQAKLAAVTQGMVSTRRLMFTPRAVHQADAMRVRAVGIEPNDDAVFPRTNWTIQGEFSDSKEAGVNLSPGIARLLQLKIGDSLVLEQRTHEGAINALTVPVASIVRVGSPALDRMGILVPWELAAELVQNKGAVSHIAVRMDDRYDAPSLANKLAMVMDTSSVETVTWQDETAGMMALQDVRRAALNLLFLALMGMSASAIANTVLMAAYERVAEIGTLRAMGMTRSDVVRLFLLEGGFMGLAGGVIGALIGGGIVGWFSTHGIDMTSLIEQTGNLPISAVLYLQWSTGVIVAAICFGLVVSVLASIYPARVASSMVPAEAVRR